MSKSQGQKKLSEDVVKPIIKVLVYECDNGAWQAEAINAGALTEGKNAQLAILGLCEAIEDLYQYSLETGERMTFEPLPERLDAFLNGVDHFSDEGRTLQFALQLVRHLPSRSNKESVVSGFKAELCLVGDAGRTWDGNAGRAT